MDAVYINTRIGPEVRKHLSMHQCTDVQLYMHITCIFVVPHADHMSNEAIGYKMLVTCCTHFYFTLYSITFCYTDINILILNAPPPPPPFLDPQQVFVLELANIAIRKCSPPPSYVSKVSLWNNMKNQNQITTHSN